MMEVPTCMTCKEGGPEVVVGIWEDGWVQAPKLKNGGGCYLPYPVKLPGTEGTKQKFGWVGFYR